MNKERIKSWLKDRQNLLFILILIFGVGLRLYYFFMTNSQPLWWDEADYLAYAKNLAGYPVDWIVTAKHNSLYPFLAGGLFAVGFNEFFVKLILQITPSILTILLVYLISNQMYKDKRVGLTAAFVLSFFWDHIFNSTRFHVDIPALFFGLLAIYIFWKGYENNQKVLGFSPKLAIPLAAFLVLLTYSIRRGHFLFGAFFLVFLILAVDFKKLYRDKFNWIALGISIALFLFVENFIFSSKIGDVSGGYFHGENPINFLPLQVFSSYFSIGPIMAHSLFYLFWIGLAISVGTLFLYFGNIRKSKIAKADLFNLISIAVTLLFFILVLRSPESFGEPRWYYPLLLSSLLMIGRSTSWIIEKLNKYHRYLFLAIIILILIAGFYQVSLTDNLVKNKVNTYESVKETGMYLNSLASPDQVIIAQPAPQLAYYSEKSVLRPLDLIGKPSQEITQEEFINKLKSSPEIEYMVISFSEPNHPPWMQSVEYGLVNGQPSIKKWKIPFMDTEIDFINQVQTLREEKSFGTLKIRLIEIKQDILIYRIIRA